MFDAFLTADGQGARAQLPAADWLNLRLMKKRRAKPVKLHEPYIES